MRQLMERNPRITKGILTLLVAGPAFVVGTIGATAGAAPPSPVPQAGGCTAYHENNQYPLKRCDKGPAIEIVQRSLRGLFEPNLVVDGYFGAATEDAVLRFQQATGEPATGLVDSETWWLLTFQPVHGPEERWPDANANGIIDPWERELPALPAPTTPPPTATCPRYRADYAYPMQLCGRGEGVRTAQLYLRVVLRDLATDGYFGPVTQDAVRMFQSTNGLPVTGEIDEPTWVKLTGGTASGHDADGDGIVDPWEVGPSATWFPPAGNTTFPLTWVVVLGVSSWEQDPGLHPLFDAAAAAGYPGTFANYCAGGAGEAVGQPPGAYWVVAIPFDDKATALQAQAAFAARDVPTGVTQLSRCFR